MEKETVFGSNHNSSAHDSSCFHSLPEIPTTLSTWFALRSTHCWVQGTLDVSLLVYRELEETYSGNRWPQSLKSSLTARFSSARTSRDTRRSPPQSGPSRVAERWRPPSRMPPPLGQETGVRSTHSLQRREVEV